MLGLVSVRSSQCLSSHSCHNPVFILFLSFLPQSMGFPPLPSIVCLAADFCSFSSLPFGLSLSLHFFLLACTFVHHLCSPRLAARAAFPWFPWNLPGAFPASAGGKRAMGQKQASVIRAQRNNSKAYLENKVKLIFPLSFNFPSSAGYPGISHRASPVAPQPIWGVGMDAGHSDTRQQSC